ncbi:MAG: restriction endonuclease subunit S [Actinomycetota bacterium]|nr:restriction endonuclease subunit S [Actinomycetota bacterium]
MAEVRSGFGFPLNLQGKMNNEIPFYKVSDMNTLGNEIEMVFHNNSISRSECEKFSYLPAPKGTVIFPKIGAAIATNKKRVLTKNSLYDNNVMGLIPTHAIVSEYLYYWLLTFNISTWASESSPPSIKKTTVEKHRILIPPLVIQKQIAAKLSMVQDYKKSLLAQKEKLKELFESTLDKSMKEKEKGS